MRNLIIKNSLYLFSSQVAIKIVSFLYSIFLARSLDVNNFGLYITALSYFSIASTFTDLGITRFIIRETARSPKNLPQFIFPIFFIRIICSFCLFLTLAIPIYLFDTNQLRVNFTLLALITILPQTINITFDNLLIALQKFSLSAFSLVTLNLSGALLGVYFITLGWGVKGALISLIVSQLLYMLVLFIFFIKQKIKFNYKINKQIVFMILRNSLPYGLLGILALIYFKIDILLISYIKGEYDTGIYGAAYKFLEAIIFIPSIAGTVLYPIFAKLYVSDLEQLKKRYYQSLLLMGLLGTLTLAVYLLILPLIIQIFLPNYLLSINAIYILALAIPFMFLHTPGVQVILSHESNVKSVFYLSIVTILFNISLNLILIPSYGYIGASWVTVFSEILSFCVFFYLLQVKIFKK